MSLFLLGILDVMRRLIFLLITLILSFVLGITPLAAQGDATAGLAYDVPVMGTIDNATPRVAYILEGLRGEVISLNLRVTNGDLDATLLIIDEAGTPLAVRGDGGGRGRDLRITNILIPNSARYYVIIGRFGYGLGNTSGNFELTIQREGVSFESGSALRYGDSVFNRITDMNPQVYYSFRAARGDVISLQMQRVSGDLDAFFQVVDRSGFVIAENDDIVGSGSLDAAIIALLIPQDGMYAIVASRFGQAAGRSRGSFVLTLETAAQSGLGTTAAMAIPLLTGNTIEGEITQERPVQFYRFTGTRDEVVSVTMNRISGNVDPFIVIASETLQELIFDDDGGGGQNAAIRDFVLPADGSYTIIATRYLRSEGTSTGRYSLTVTSEGSVFAGMREGAIRINYGTTMTGRLDDNTPEMLYAFYGQANDAITVSMSRADGDLDSVVTILDSNMTALVSDDDGGNDQDARIARYTLPARGLYYIRAGRFANDSGLPTRGSFMLVLARLQN